MVTTGLKVKRKSETSSSVKKRIEEGLRADPDKVLEQRELNQPRIFSRPTGTTSERNVEVTNLSPEERNKIQRQNALEGREIRRIKEGEALAQALENITGKKGKLEDLQKEQIGELESLREEDFTKLRNPEKVQTQEGDRTALDVAKDLVFGNILEKDPFSGETRIDPETGQPVRGILNIAPIGQGSGASTIIPKVGSSIKKAGVAVGAIAGLSASTVFGLVTSGKTSELESDITDITTASGDVVRDVSRGADVNEAIESLQEAEDEIRFKIGELNVAIEKSPKDRLKGKDTQSMAYKNLNTIIRRRQALERFAINGDAQSLINSVGVTE